MKEELRSGYTTGTCGAVAAYAALDLLLNDKYNGEIKINSLNGIQLKVPVEKLKKGPNWARAVVLKDGGDDIDATHGIEICAKVTLVDQLPEVSHGMYRDNILILGGRGIGKITKKGLQVEIGKPAINPGPQKMIFENLQGLLKNIDKKVIVRLYIPKGREIAKRTFNPRLGILGGISVLGSTGIVKPMSEEAWKDSLFVELKVLKENTGRDWVIFAFGNHGKSFCEKMGIDISQMVVISNFVGFMIDSAVKLGFKKILLIGHIGKAIKIAGGIFNTHSRVADGRLEILAANGILVDEPRENLLKVMGSNTVEEACEYIQKKELFNLIGNKVAFKCKEYSRGEIEFEGALFTFSGDLIGHSENFYNMAGELVGK